MQRNQLIALLSLASLALLVWVAGPRLLDGDRSHRVADGVVYNRAGIAIGGVEPNPSGGTPLNIDNIVAYREKAVVVSLDAADTFFVPGPNDPQWADYLEYRRHFRSSLDNSEGFAVAYDPDWRVAVTGVRPAPEPGLMLHGGRASVRELVQGVLAGAIAQDQQALVDFAIRKEEFEIICWPSFPQSRPYLRVPVTEAWGFQYANLLGGSREGMRQAGQRDLELREISIGSSREYNGWFTLHNGVRIHAVDRASGEEVTLTFLDSIIEQDGEYKVFLYKD